MVLFSYTTYEKASFHRNQKLPKCVHLNTHRDTLFSDLKQTKNAMELSNPACMTIKIIKKENAIYL